MTKDGFAELAMSYTGEASRVIRITFLAAFNAMADFIRRTQRNLWQQMMDWEQRNASSLVRASFGSRMMLDRKRALPSLKEEKALLDAKIQPSLFEVLA